MTKPIHDPALYRKLSEPFENRQAADAAFDAFAEEFRALREKHRIADAVYIACVSVKDGDKEQQIMVYGNAGDAYKLTDLMYMAFGQQVLYEANRFKSMMPASRKEKKE